MEKMTNYEMIYRLAQSNKIHLKELLEYMKRDSNVSDNRLERFKQELTYLENIEINMSIFVKGCD
ncbi:hypothetical protein U9L70_06500 [Staphylococcus equorum]|uniref:hypothetical protein n=1 Tax=Staphylococcus equorum TaxID=246432 RepID=UPI003980C319